jgi:hypothetical protein
MTAPFDWEELADAVLTARKGNAPEYLRYRIEKAFVPREAHDLIVQTICENHAKHYARAEAAEAKVAVLREALTRQGDNMAFVLNNFDVPSRWYEKLQDELLEDRQALQETANG